MEPTSGLSRTLVNAVDVDIGGLQAFHEFPDGILIAAGKGLYAGHEVGGKLRVSRLTFLALNLVKAAVEGRLPRGIGVERLRDPPTEWSRQVDALGLNPE